MIRRRRFQAKPMVGGLMASQQTSQLKEATNAAEASTLPAASLITDELLKIKTVEDRKEAEEILQIQQEPLSLSFEAAPISVVNDSESNNNDDVIVITDLTYSIPKKDFAENDSTYQNVSIQNLQASNGASGSSGLIPSKALHDSDSYHCFAFNQVEQGSLILEKQEPCTHLNSLSLPHIKKLHNILSPCSTVSSMLKSPQTNFNANHMDIVVDEDIDVDVGNADDECTQSSVISLQDNAENSKNRRSFKRRRKSALQDEDLDTKKFTLADLIDWRPKTENTLRKKWDEKRQKMLETMSNSGTSASDSVDLDSKSKDQVKCMGPRVKINEKGEMVLDEDSLVVTNDADVDLWETIDDIFRFLKYEKKNYFKDLMPKKLNSMSFRKRYTRTVNWTVAETDLFYEVLSATGTDFGLMNEFISGRSRAEIKKKFHREEKSNDSRISDVLCNPTLLDETLYTRIEKLKKRIEHELEEKILAKQKPSIKGKRGRPRKITIEPDAEVENASNNEEKDNDDDSQNQSAANAALPITTRSGRVISSRTTTIH